MGTALKYRTTNFQEIAHRMDTGVKSGSNYRRIQRFFSKEMNLAGIGLFCLEEYLDEILGHVSGKYRIELLIDRNEWHWGRVVHNCLYLFLNDPSRGVSFPVKVIDLGSRGNSGQTERRELLEDVLWYLRPLIREGRLEVTIMGDREFVGERWEEFLSVHNLGYLLRVRRDYRLADGRSVEEIYTGLSVGESKDVKVDGWRLIVHRLGPAKGRRDECLALVTLDTKSSARRLLKKYCRRWMIERGFFNMNTNGFEIKRTHITSVARLEMLIYVLMFCYFLVMVIGLLKEQLFGKRIKKHGHREISVFLNGLRTLLHISSISKPLKEYTRLLRHMDIELLRLLNLLTNSMYCNLLQQGVV